MIAEGLVRTVPTRTICSLDCDSHQAEHVLAEKEHEKDEQREAVENPEDLAQNIIHKEMRAMGQAHAMNGEEFPRRWVVQETRAHPDCSPPGHDGKGLRDSRRPAAGRATALRGCRPGRKRPGSSSPGALRPASRPGHCLREPWPLQETQLGDERFERALDLQAVTILTAQAELPDGALEQYPALVQNHHIFTDPFHVAEQVRG